MLKLAHRSWSLQVPFALTVGLRSGWVRRGDVARVERLAGVDAERIALCRCGSLARRGLDRRMALHRVGVRGVRAAPQCLSTFSSNEASV